MPDQTGPTPDPFVNATLALSDDEFFALYGPWTPMAPEEVGEMLSGIPDRPECHQVWMRRDARSPWRLELLIDRASTAEEWVFKRDHSVRVPWDRALYQLGRVTYLRPELALLFKAGQDREKDREDLAAARLTPEGREWLAVTLERLGNARWAELTCRTHLPVNRNPTSHRT